MPSGAFETESQLGARMAERLRSEKAIWLTTVGKDGTPQPNPVWFVWDCETVLVYSHNRAARLGNLAANSRVALNFDTADRGQADVNVITGTARIALDEPPVTGCEAYLAKYAEAIASDLGSNTEEYATTYSVAIRITPERMRGF